MSVAKRGFALALAAMMILMTVSMVWAQTAFAANPYTVTVSNVTATPATFKEGGTVSRVEFNVVDITSGIGKNAVTAGAVISMHKNSHFTGGSIQVADTSPSNTAPNYANFKVVATDLTVKAPGTTLIFTVEDSSTNYKKDIEVAIPGFDSGSSGGGEGTPPPSITDNTARYTVNKVMGTKRENNNDVPNKDRVYFDIENLTSSSDASIRQTYFADITLRVTDKEAPGTVTTKDIMLGSSNTQEMGSFLYQKGISTAEITNAMEGYYEVKLTGLRYSGNSKKINLRVQSGASYIGDITAEVSECITRKEAAAEGDKNNNNNNNDHTLEVETPYVIVSKYSYGGGTVTAGDTFPLSLTFYNTSQTEVVSNMMITITMPDDLMLTSSSNTFYVEELDKRASITKSVQVTAKAAAKVQSHNISVAMKYQYVDDKLNSRKDAATTETIAIPVTQIDRFQVTGVEIPMEVMLGEETSVTVNYVNKGRSEAYNLSAQIDGNIQNPGQNQNLGNLASGTAGTADFFILPNEVGMCTGEVKITYEDTNMEEKTATIRYSTTVKSAEEFQGGMGGGMIMGGMGGGAGVMGEETPPPEEPKSKVPYIVVGVVVVAIPAAIVIKKRLDKKRKEREDADL